MCTEYKNITIWIIGDSISKTYESYLAPLTGIGQVLPQFCKPGIKIENHARCGAGTRTFLDNGFWEAVINGIKKDDYLLIKFGHNDLNKKRPEVYAEAKTIYHQNLTTFIQGAKNNGAHPILITSMCRRIYYKSGVKAGALRRSLGSYPKYCRIVAKEQNVPLLDLNNISFAKISAMSRGESKKLYNHVSEGSKYTYWTTEKGKKVHIDNSHLNLEGAKTVAKWLVDDAKKQKLELAKLFK
jgi:lysophospholipase L1-like esterase